MLGAYINIVMEKAVLFHRVAGNLKDRRLVHVLLSAENSFAPFEQCSLGTGGGGGAVPFLKFINS